MQDNSEIRNEHLRHNSTSDDPDQVRMHRRMQEQQNEHGSNMSGDSQQMMDDNSSMGSGNMQHGMSSSGMDNGMDAETGMPMDSSEQQQMQDSSSSNMSSQQGWSGSSGSGSGSMDNNQQQSR